MIDSFKDEILTATRDSAEFFVTVLNSSYCQHWIWKNKNMNLLLTRVRSNGGCLFMKKNFSKGFYLACSMHYYCTGLRDITLSLHFFLKHNIFPNFLGRTSILKHMETGRMEIISEYPSFLLRENNERMLWFPWEGEILARPSGSLCGTGRVPIFFQGWKRLLISLWKTYISIINYLSNAQMYIWIIKCFKVLWNKYFFMHG